jgi:hypothetical protein
VRYLSDNLGDMNILLPSGIGNLQNSKILRPRYPRGAERVPAATERRCKPGSQGLVLAAILTLSIICRAQNTLPAPVEIVNLEQNFWTTMAEGNFTTVRSLFTKDFIQVNEKIQAADSILVNLKHCRLESYELRDLQVRILSPDSALTAYHVVDTFNCGTEDHPEVKNNDNNSITVWVRQPNTKKWLVQAHTETPTQLAK